MFPKQNQRDLSVEGNGFLLEHTTPNTFELHYYACILHKSHIPLPAGTTFTSFDEEKKTLCTFKCSLSSQGHNLSVASKRAKRYERGIRNYMKSWIFYRHLQNSNKAQDSIDKRKCGITFSSGAQCNPEINVDAYRSKHSNHIVRLLLDI